MPRETGLSGAGKDFVCLFFLWRLKVECVPDGRKYGGSEDVEESVGLMFLFFLIEGGVKKKRRYR